MVLKIDFNSDEAIYIQLRNQIIMGIATDMIREGDTLPSVRQMADYIGINMHTVKDVYKRQPYTSWKIHSAQRPYNNWQNPGTGKRSRILC